MDAQTDAGLVTAVEDLFARQQAGWEQLAEGIESLRQARERRFDVDGFTISARHLPHRIRSTTAEIDAAAVSSRPCFLCPENRPVRQRGIPMGQDFEILCNPYPILERHLTIVSREHVPQRLVGASSHGIRTMLGIARALPDFVVLYNGPESGASAPDHLHFQAARSDRLPVFAPASNVEGGVMPDYPGSVIVIAGRDVETVAVRFESAAAQLPVRSGAAEAMVNVAVVFRDGRWDLRLFPRARHRPGVYESGEFTWSPGAIDMCGLAVLPRPGDLERLTTGVVRSTYREVSIPAADARRIAAGTESYDG